MSSIAATTSELICQATIKKRLWPTSSISEVRGDGGRNLRLRCRRRRSRWWRAGRAVGRSREAGAAAGRRRRPCQAVRRSSPNPAVVVRLYGARVSSFRFRKPRTEVGFLGAPLRVCSATEERLALSPMLGRSEEHTSELQSRQYLVCRLLL